MSKIDVVVPCYNYGRFLNACVRSVLDQSVSDLRVLIIDDASTDDSLARAQELANSNSRVSVISHQENWGHIRTYNQGIDWASADYFLLLSADDLLAPGAVERAVSLMDAQKDIVLAHGKYIIWSDDAPFPQIAQTSSFNVFQQDLIWEICTQATNLVATPTAIVRTSVQKAVGGYCPSLPHTGDMEMFLRIAAYGHVLFIDAVQAVYRKHSSSMSNSYFANLLSDFRQRKLAFDTFFETSGARLPDSRRLQAMANQQLAETVFGYGVRYLSQRRVRPGLQFIEWSLHLDGRSRPASRFWDLAVTKVRKRIFRSDQRTRNDPKFLARNFS